MSKLFQKVAERRLGDSVEGSSDLMNRIPVDKVGPENAYDTVTQQLGADTGWASGGPLGALQNLLKQRQGFANQTAQFGQGFGSGGGGDLGWSGNAGQNARLDLNNLMAIGGGHYLRKDAGQAYQRLLRDANAAGINVGIASSYRDYDKQASLYQQYLDGTGNLAAKPGHSNHGWGLSLDFNVSSNPQLLGWLRNNASKYGFHNDVPSENWHWTYNGSHYPGDGHGH